MQTWSMNAFVHHQTFACRESCLAYQIKCLSCLQELAFDQKTATELTVKHIARVTGCWQTFDPNVLAALSAHHVWTDEFLTTRLKWRAKQPITVMELRCSELQQPLVFPPEDDYWGCFSWVILEQGVQQPQLEEATDVINDSEYKEKQHEVRTVLQRLTDCSEVSMS